MVWRRGELGVPYIGEARRSAAGTASQWRPRPRRWLGKRSGVGDVTLLTSVLTSATLRVADRWGSLVSLGERRWAWVRERGEMGCGPLTVSVFFNEFY